jgi:hypothetical protein
MDWHSYLQYLRGEGEVLRQSHCQIVFQQERHFSIDVHGSSEAALAQRPLSLISV